MLGISKKGISKNSIFYKKVGGVSAKRRNTHKIIINSRYAGGQIQS
jgi:hypothetical protein